MQLETVTKTARLWKLWFAIEMGQNDSKNTVVKNEVCISCVLTDLEMLTNGVMKNKFCGLSLIHANPSANLFLNILYQKGGQQDIG